MPVPPATVQHQTENLTIQSQEPYSDTTSRSLRHGYLWTPPKAKIRHTFRKPNGKTLNANRRNKLLHLLKAERNKGKTFGGKLPRNSAVDNRPSTSAGIATMVPPLMISSSVASSVNANAKVATHRVIPTAIAMTTRQLHINQNLNGQS